MAMAHNPYGDGQAAARIAAIVAGRGAPDFEDAGIGAAG
jgi:UDP-N-acetylglucosamine 2-epimerase